MINIRLKDGTIYKQFISGSVLKDIEEFVGSFAFESSVNFNDGYPITLHDYVEILVDDKQVLNGYIEKIEIINNLNNRTLRVFGRGILCDIIDSSIKNVKEFGGVDIKLENICKKVMHDLGIYNKEIINQAGEIKSFSNSEIQSVETSSTAFDFLETLALKRQILLNSDGYGNLILIRGNSERSNKSLRNIVAASDNNIISSKLKADASDRFYCYTVKSDINLTNIESVLDPDVVVNQEGIYYDDYIRKTRYLEITPDENINSEDSQKRAAWEFNFRKTRGSIYSAVVAGHCEKVIIDNKVVNKLWEINKLIDVKDDFCKIYDTLLIKSVEYNYSINEGSTTNIVCVPKDSYKLLKQNKKKSNEIIDRLTTEFFKEDDVADTVMKGLDKLYEKYHG